MKTALYRKYRPVDFDGVIGQDVIVATLKNQITKGALSHAYLFTGSRGTGKTTCAKIFARAVNCQSPVGGNPCGKCPACLALSRPGNLDIVEMDAASNNGVDKIRELRENVDYMPSAGKYKVYIIDEVHMLSVSAFNALLKTLEEPPAHVIFVLCTTEVHKLPATILSRCMRFDFRLVSEDKLAALLKDIFAKEGVTADESAVRHIARLGEGSVRDCLSVADRCICAGGRLTGDLVLELTGAGKTEDTAALLEKVLASDVTGVVRQVEKLAAAGRSASALAHELTLFARDLILIKSGAEADVTASEETLARMRGLAARTDIPFLVRLIRETGKGEAELRYSTSPRIVLESVLLSLCEGVTGEYEPFPKRSGTPSAGGAPRENNTQSAPHADGGAQAAPPVHAETFRRDGDDPAAVRVLGFIRHELRKRGEMRLFGEYADLADGKVRLKDGLFTVYVESGSFSVFASAENMDAINEILSELGGYRLAVEKLPEDSVNLIDILTESAKGLKISYVDGKGRSVRR